MKPIIVIISTPRCGTQWLAKNLGQIYADKAVVTHEPIENDYYLKLNLGRYDLPMLPEPNPKLDEHLEFIHEVIQKKIYIEVGWQSIAGIPELYRRYGDSLKIIHLYRNPLYVAASLVTHNWYTGKVKDRFDKSELNPFDEVSILTEYKDRWENLDFFEKALYYWTEINLRAIEIKYLYPEVPVFSLKFEDLFNENKETSRICLISTLSFMGLQYNKKMLESINISYDNYKYKTNLKVDSNDIYKHPQTIVLANKLGYSIQGKTDLGRYKKSSFLQRVSVFIGNIVSHISDFFFHFF